MNAANHRLFHDPIPITEAEERFAGRDATATEQGMGESRDLLTQSGQEVAFAQATPLTQGNVYTATFDVIPPTDDDGNMVSFAAQIQVRYSENGNDVQRIFSLVQGVSISLPGRVIDVRVVDTTLPVLPISEGTPTPGAGSKYVVKMTLERGTRPAEGRPPTLFGGVSELSASAAIVYPIPLRAGAMTVCVSAGGFLPFVGVGVTFNGPGGVGLFKGYTQPGNATPHFVTIPPGATEIVITNLDSSSAAPVSVEWGIDG